MKKDQLEEELLNLQHWGFGSNLKNEFSLLPTKHFVRIISTMILSQNMNELKANKQSNRLSCCPGRLIQGTTFKRSLLPPPTPKYPDNRHATPHPALSFFIRHYSAHFSLGISQSIKKSCTQVWWFGQKWPPQDNRELHFQEVCPCWKKCVTGGGL